MKTSSRKEFQIGKRITLVFRKKKQKPIVRKQTIEIRRI